MKKFNVPVNSGSGSANIDVLIGDPKEGNHPLQNQANWLSKERGAAIPQKIMDAFQKLLDISKKEGVSFEELCQYAFTKYGKNMSEDAEEEEGDSDQRDMAKEQRMNKGKGIE